MGERRNDGRRWFEPPKDMPGNQIHSTATKEVQRLQHSLDRDDDLMQLEETIMIEAALVDPRIAALQQQ
jgi:hypothetical protein